MAMGGLARAAAGVIAAAGMVCGAAGAGTYSGGAGTAESPYRIGSAADVLEMSETPEDWGGQFLMIADVDLAGYVFDKVVIAPDESDKMGFQGKRFTGVFDGGGRTIHNFTADAPERAALFGECTGAIIRDLHLRGVQVQAGKIAAALAIYIEGEVCGCSSEGAVRSEQRAAGLIATVGPGSSAGPPVEIKACWTRGEVTGVYWTGGLIGRVWDTHISDCWSDCTVKGLYEIGGLAGSCGILLPGYNVTLTRCWSEGVVEGETGHSDGRVGGLVGSGFCTLEDCHSTAEVTGEDEVGGLVGYADEDASVSGCSFTGSVAGRNNVGGIVGQGCSAFEDCAVQATVSGRDYVGGVVGAAGRSGARVVRCRASGRVSGRCYVGGLAGGAGGLAGGVGWFEESYSTADVVGSEDYVGGLAGAGEVTVNSYCTGAVKGRDFVGGLIGIWGRRALNCYIAGRVEGTGEHVDPVGAVGEIRNVYWDAQAWGRAWAPPEPPAVAIHCGGLSERHMRMYEAYLIWLEQWDGSVAEESAWTIAEGELPRLAWEGQPGRRITAPSFEGSGTGQDPYLIQTAADFYLLGYCPFVWGRSFRMTADIDIREYCQRGDLRPIGYRGWDWYSGVPFSGYFFGEGHAIRGFECERFSHGALPAAEDGEDGVGLFGRSYGYIRGVTVVDPNVGGPDVQTVGALVGEMGHVLRDCAVIGGRVEGDRNVGGLVGKGLGSMRGCTSDCDVYGREAVGGVIGQAGYVFYRGETFSYSDGCRVEGCDFGGRVFGTDECRYVGGVVGSSRHAEYGQDSIGCRVTGTIQVGGGAYSVGGIAGEHAWREVSDCVADVEIIAGDGAERIGGALGGGILRRSEVRARVTVGAESVSIGGMVGEGGATECVLDAEVLAGEGSQSVGGGVGTLYSGGMRHCTGQVQVEAGEGSRGTGGLAGRGSPTECRVTGQVTGDEAVGGLVGWIKGVVTGCEAACEVAGRRMVGGLAGENLAEVTESFALGTVAGEEMVGGLIGRNAGSVAMCYAAAAVDEGGGGLIGVREEAGETIASFWDVEAAGAVESAGGTAAGTQEMRESGLFLAAGWDFSGEEVNGTADVWRMCEEGAGYPQPAWVFAMEGDFVCPDGIEIGDLAAFVEQWLTWRERPQDYVRGDLNLSGRVDWRDFAMMAEKWLAGDRVSGPDVN